MYQGNTNQVSSEGGRPSDLRSEFENGGAQGRVRVGALQGDAHEPISAASQDRVAEHVLHAQLQSGRVVRIPTEKKEQVSNVNTHKSLQEGVAWKLKLFQKRFDLQELSS